MAVKYQRYFSESVEEVAIIYVYYVVWKKLQLGLILLPLLNGVRYTFTFHIQAHQHTGSVFRFL